MKSLRQAIIALAILTLITGVIYPLFIYLIGKTVFPYQTNGSLIVKNDQVIGSELIGQQFSQAKYFWSRPSATGNYPYNGLASGSSNLGPLNPTLISQIADRVKSLQNSSEAPIPVDLVTASASGLDPEISIAAAYYQINRIANARHLSASKVQELIDQNAKYPAFGILGEPRVNVLNLNLALDNMKGGE